MDDYTGEMMISQVVLDSELKAFNHFTNLITRLMASSEKNKLSPNLGQPVFNHKLVFQSAIIQL